MNQASPRVLRLVGILTFSLLFFQPGTPAQEEEPPQQKEPVKSVCGRHGGFRAGNLWARRTLVMSAEADTWNWKDDLLSWPGAAD